MNDDKNKLNIGDIILLLILMSPFIWLFVKCSDSGDSANNKQYNDYHEYYYDKNDTDGDGKLEGNEADNYFNDIFD